MHPGQNCAFRSFWVIFGSFWVILAHFGSFWVILVIFDLNRPKTRIWPYFLPTGPNFQNSNTSRCGIPMCTFASFCENCERNFFYFFIFWLRVKGFFLLGFSFLSSVGTFQRERKIFLSIFFIPRKLQTCKVQLKKGPLIISSSMTCQKLRKLGVLAIAMAGGEKMPSPICQKKFSRGREYKPHGYL